MSAPRIDRAERRILAPPLRVYRAFIEARALEAWLPPADMTGEVHEIDAREGGGYSMTLRLGAPAPGARGKSSETEDRFDVRFERLVPGELVAQVVVFDADAPEFDGAMHQTWTMTPDGAATRVQVACRNVPEGVRPEDHEAGLASSLEKLAQLVEVGPSTDDTL